MSTETDDERELLVAGFVREIEKAFKVKNIPIELINIIYYIKEYVMNFVQRYSSDAIEIDETKTVITMRSMNTATAYGTRIVSEGIFKWKIKMVKWTHDGISGSPPFIGIIEDDDKYLKRFRNATGWFSYGYELCGSSGSLYAPDGGLHEAIDGNCKWEKEGDVLEVFLNLDDRTQNLK